MIAKKSSKADLEKRRFAFFQIGLILAGSFCLIAFEYSSASEGSKTMSVLEPADNTVIIDIPIDYTELPAEPPRPKAVVNVNNLTEINVVEKLTEKQGVATTENEKIAITEGTGTDEVFTQIVNVDPPTDIFDYSEVPPGFPGGEKEILQKEVDYPEDAQLVGEQGTVYTEFVVNRDGSIVQAKILRGPSKSLENEALRVIRKMPRWTPGEQAGKKVRVKFVLPINFVIG